MRMVFSVALLCLVLLLCFPTPALAKDLIYASDYYGEGNNLVNKGQYGEALEMYRTARSMDERFYNEHYGISYQIGWVLNKLGRYEEALKEFQIAEKYQPEWVAPFAVYYNEGCLLAKLGKNEEALEALDSALMYQPHNWFILYNKGVVLSRMGRYADAVATFDESRKVFGIYPQLLGSYQETAATYDLAQGITPRVTYPQSRAAAVSVSPRSVATDIFDQETSVDQLIRTGTDFSDRYQYEDALVAFERALEIEPSNYRAMFYKGNALANSGRYTEAEYALNQALLWLDYRRHEGWYVDTQYTKAWVLAQKGNYDEAIKTYDKIFIINPDFYRAHYSKAWVLAQQGKYEDAAKEYNRSLEWEKQYTLDVQSYTILGPLGTYQEVADAYDKTKSTRSFVSALPAQPSYDRVIYQTDFSTDPGWRTSATRLYFWDSANKSYHFRSDTSPGLAEIEIPYTGTPFQLEYDITIPHADPGTLVRFGLAQHNTSENEQNVMVRYNSENLVMGEFKSWRAGTYRNAKDGEKTVEVYAIDDRKYAFDTEYEGWCKINREESITIPSFGENRIYHGIIISDPEKETISFRVTDNLHEKTYYVCSRKWVQTGRFSGMNRLILVAEPAENAYIEGSIDNIVLSVPAVPVQTVVPAGTTPAPVPSGLINPPGPNVTIPHAPVGSLPTDPSPSGTGTGLIGFPPGIFTTPAVLVPVILLVMVVIVLFIAADYLNKRKMK